LIVPSAERVLLFVDRAAGSASLLPLLEKADLPVSDAHLGWADVELTGRGEKGKSVFVGIELKRLSELTTDWDRFAGHQVPKMLDHYDHRYLVVEGEWIQNRRGTLLKRAGKHTFKPLHGQCDASALRKKLITLEMCGGFHVCLINHWAREGSWTPETVRFIANLYHWWTDEDFDQHKSHIVNYEPKGIIPLNEFERGFAAWPGLSTVRARAVSRVFNRSIALACLASPKMWANISVPDDHGGVRRFGTKLATRITEYLHGQTPKR